MIDEDDEAVAQQILMPLLNPHGDGGEFLNIGRRMNEFGAKLLTEEGDRVAAL